MARLVAAVAVGCDDGACLLSGGVVHPALLARCIHPDIFHCYSTDKLVAFPPDVSVIFITIIIIMEGEVATSSGKKRSSSEIAKQCWHDKRQKVHEGAVELKQAKKEAERLQKLNETLTRLNSSLLEEKAAMKVAIAREKVATAELTALIAREQGKVAELNASLAREKDEKADLSDSIARERGEQLAELDRLEAENELLSQSMKECAPFVKSMEDYGGFTKVSNKETLIAAVGSAILAVLSILMRRTQPISRLRTLCEVLFGQAIYGAAVTAKVLDELYDKYLFRKQRDLFAPWKILRAIDTSSVGGLNYNGLETLRSCEQLGKYERGVLPS